MIEFRHLRGQPLGFALHFVQFVEDGEALVKDGPAGELEPFLRQIADADAARLIEGAVIEGLEAGKNLHQRGFAGAVGADQRSFFVVADEPIRLEEEHSRPESFPGILQ